jgi:hypothetical protein
MVIAIDKKSEQVYKRKFPVIAHLNPSITPAIGFTEYHFQNYVAAQTNR